MDYRDLDHAIRDAITDVESIRDAMAHAAEFAPERIIRLQHDLSRASRRLTELTYERAARRQDRGDCIVRFRAAEGRHIPTMTL